LSKKLNTKQLPKLIAVICLTPLIASAQDAWQFNSSITAMTGHYVDSLTMNNQQGLGARISGEKSKSWGFTAGLQSTRIDMAPISPASTQNQDNWLLSGYAHKPSIMLPGRWTFQLDAHQVHNDAQQSNTSDVHSFAQQITWLSYTQPLKVDFSYASSNYKNTPATIHQFSSAIAYGFNDATDWLQVRSYAINNLTTSEALGQSSSRATDFKLTHFLKSQYKWAPTNVTVGLERGKRIYVLDMASQTLYNLPMLNEGGENIAANWKLSPKTDLNLQFSQTRYYAIPTHLPSHRFTLGTLSAQIATTW
jgi:hypothetical protein